MAFPFFFFFNYTATTEIYPLSLHDALPIFRVLHRPGDVLRWRELVGGPGESPDGSPRWMGGEPHPSDVGRAGRFRFRDVLHRRIQRTADRPRGFGRRVELDQG